MRWLMPLLCMIYGLPVRRLSPETRLRVMRSIRKTNTKPELIVRRLAHRLGYRFRRRLDQV